jgi:hypothetical protein
VGQAKETNSVVDIGFHYVAVDSATGLPLDTDGDGLPDSSEDRDGDGQGLTDSGESDWQSAVDLGLRVWLLRPSGHSPAP